MSASPKLYTWQGDGFTPLPRFAKACDEDFVVGEVYLMGEVAEREWKRHKAFFAGVNEAWKSLHEGYGDFFKNPDHLRKWCLIQEGFCTQENFVLQSKKEAKRFAGFMRKGEEFRVVTIEGRSVTVYTAASQQVLRKGKGMDNEMFKHSVRRVQHRLDGMLGTKPGTVAKQRGSA